MPLTVNVGLSHKTSENFNSRGVSINLTAELDQSLLARPDDLLLLDELYLPRQQTTSVTVAFDDESVADFFEDQVAAGRSPEQFGRIWIHTHPGNCPRPSS